MKWLTDPLLLRMAVVFVAAAFLFIVGIFLMRRLRRGLTGEDAERRTSVDGPEFQLAAYHGVIQQLKEKEQELQRVRQQATERAAASQTLSDVLLSNLTSGVLLFNNTGTVRQANEAARRILGYGTAFGMHARDLFRGVSELRRETSERAEMVAPSPSPVTAKAPRLPSRFLRRSRPRLPWKRDNILNRQTPRGYTLGNPGTVRKVAMKRMWNLTLAALLMGLALGAAAQEVSLGDYARKQREQQKPASPTTKVYTNDDIGSSPAAAASATTSAPADSDADKSAAKDEKTKAEDEKAKAEEMNKAAEEFKGKVAEAKTKIAEIRRNMDVSEREFKLHSIDWYTEAGNALLDPKKYKDETDKHNKEMDDLRKQLADAQAELEKIRDEIRKAGLSSSLGD
ncbi:MAG TPA: PAS domain-containing protein [Terriglobales bacterium]|nr:PAS domain-containing protein [Terriglobales bacterium]